MTEPYSSRYKGKAEAAYEEIARITAGHAGNIRCTESREAIISHLETAFLQIETELTSQGKAKHRQCMD